MSLAIWDAVTKLPTYGGVLMDPEMSEHPAFAAALPVLFSVSCAVQLALAAPVSSNCSVEAPVSISAIWPASSSPSGATAGTLLPRTSARSVLQTVRQFDWRKMFESENPPLATV